MYSLWSIENKNCVSNEKIRIKIEMKIPLRCVLCVRNKKYKEKMVWIKYKCVTHFDIHEPKKPWKAKSIFMWFLNDTSSRMYKSQQVKMKMSFWYLTENVFALYHTHTCVCALQSIRIPHNSDSYPTNVVKLLLRHSQSSFSRPTKESTLCTRPRVCMCVCVYMSESCSGVRTIAKSLIKYYRSNLELNRVKTVASLIQAASKWAILLT